MLNNVLICGIIIQNLQLGVSYMSIQKVREYMKQFDKESSVMEFDVSSATVELAAIALNTQPARIAKSMALDVKGECVIVVVAGDCKIDNAKYKAYFHTKAKMLGYEETSLRTGHAPGGVCPFALNENVKVYLDISMQRFTTVFPACGSGNSAIELTCDEMEKMSDNFVEWVDVCKNTCENN